MYAKAKSPLIFPYYAYYVLRLKLFVEKQAGPFCNTFGKPLLWKFDVLGLHLRPAMSQQVLPSFRREEI